MIDRQKESFIHQAITNVDSTIGSVIGTTLDDITCQDRSGNAVVIDKSKVNAEIDRLYAEYDALSWKRSRQEEYPDMGTQFNKIYDDGIDAWKTDMVDPIKAKYPKP
jgi:hypothetical protein